MITKEDIFSSFKYYKGEKDNPFNGEKNSALWWEGEKLMYDACKNQGFIDGLCEDYEMLVTSNNQVEPLLLQNKTLPQKLILIFLDLWHGKWFPYEGEENAIYSY